MQRLAPHADAILAARAAYPDATLADLYDPDLMPVDLRKAHQALDRAVDRLYRRSGFTSERERVETPARTVRKNAGAADGKDQAEAAEAKAFIERACQNREGRWPS